MTSVDKEIILHTATTSDSKNVEYISLYSEQCWSILSDAKNYWKIKEHEDDKVKEASNNYAPIGVVFRNGIAVGNVLENPIPSSANAVVDVDNYNIVEKNNNMHDGTSSDESDVSYSESDSASDDVDEDGEDHVVATESNEKISQKDTTDNGINGKKSQDKNKNTIRSKIKLSRKEYEIILRKQWEVIPKVTLPFPVNSTNNIASNNNKAKRNDVQLAVLEVSTLLFRRDDITITNSIRCESLQRLITSSSRLNQTRELRRCSMIVILLRSGRFAAGVFSKPITGTTVPIDSKGSTKSSSMHQKVQIEEQSYNNSTNNCIAHRTSVRYTVRRGQGKAQSTQDNQRRPKSIGSQLRREGEKQLQNDIAKTIIAWKKYFDQADFIFVSIPKTMQKYFYDATTTDVNIDSINGFSGEYKRVADIVSPRDPRIGRIPLDLGRPTYEAVCLFHSIITTVHVVHEPTYCQQELTNVPILVEESVDTNETDEAVQVPTQPDDETNQVCDSFPPLSPLHIAAQEGNIEQIQKLVSMMEEEQDRIDEPTAAKDVSVIANIELWKNSRAGEFLMTPLHVAAASTSPLVSPYSLDPTQTPIDPQIAAECLKLLLVSLRCDPCIVDIRNRVPYFLASNEKVREAFRISRSVLGEDYCLWDTKAKVGPPLSLDDIQLRKQREAEKRRQKRQRQKQQRAQEKAKHGEIVQPAKGEPIRVQSEELSRQNGLHGGRECDFCQTVCVGKKKALMFKRLDYSYCSTDCVNSHKRELMANAAMARVR